MSTKLKKNYRHVYLLQISSLENVVDLIFVLNDFFLMEKIYPVLTLTP